MTYKQLVSSTKSIFYNMDGEEIEVDLPEYAYDELNEAIYEWETKQ